MAKFIKLTRCDHYRDQTAMWINADNIDVIYGNPDGAEVLLASLSSNEIGIEVTETPEQILALISGGVGNGEA